METDIKFKLEWSLTPQLTQLKWSHFRDGLHRQ